MKFLIAGTGGVGGFFGAKLAAAGNEVWFMARGKHLEAMRKNGLHVRSTKGTFDVGPERIIAHPREADMPDIVLFCVKSYDNEATASQLLESEARSSMILSLQNGIDNEDSLRALLPEAMIVGGVAYISARIDEPGSIVETGGFQRIVFGAFEQAEAALLEPLNACFAAAQIKADLTNDIRRELWKKFIFISAMSGVSSLTRLTQGEILDVEETRMLVFNAMKEAEAVGLASGIGLEPLVKEQVFESMARFSRGTRASMAFDLVNKKPMELDALSGAVARLGARLGIPTPIHSTMYAALLPHHLLALQSSGPNGTPAASLPTT
jgi:2-dehydropantoate 2-reductase